MATKIVALAISIAFIAGIITGSGLVTPSQSSAQTVVIDAPGPPPAPRVEPMGTAPNAGLVWVPGHWAWRSGSWVWITGHWSQTPRGEHAWVAGHWVHQARGWVFVDGHWR